ncbi:MAG: YdcF family protein [Patescibacteria group bacterium]|nr:YdcF family protein [Patescibacteria group bacterium]
MTLSRDKRKTSVQLPSSDAIDSIIQSETPRDIHPKKKKSHFTSFETAIDWLEHINIASDLFIDNHDPRKALEMAVDIQDKVVSATMDAVKKKDAGLLGILAQVGSFLGEEDIGHNGKYNKSDLILVFGSSDLSRIEKGVELWKAGVAPILMISGGQPYYKEQKVPEAVTFARHALSLGVPKCALLLEPNSISLADNVKTSLCLLDALGFDYSKNGITSVVVWFGQRRVYYHLMKFSQPGVQIHRVNTSLDSGKLTVNHWFKSDFGIRVVFNEFVKMRGRVLYNTN